MNAPALIDDEIWLEGLPDEMTPEQFDGFEVELRERFGQGLNPYQAELFHHFTPGLYVREYRARAGTIHLSKIHTTTHPFVVTFGSVIVWTRGGGREWIKAPHFGLTVPDTQRVLLVAEDLIWMTFHPNPDNLTDPDEIVGRLTKARVA